MSLRTYFGRKAKTRSPLERSIALSGTLLIISVIAITLWSLYESWQRNIRQAEEMAVNLALSQARQAEDTFLQTEISLNEIQRDLLEQMPTGVDGAKLSATMRDLQERLPQLHGLFYYDARGKWIATSAKTVPDNINNSDREYFLFHRTNPRTSIHIGPVIRSRSTGDQVIPVSMRVNDATGGFNGVLLATIKVDYFRRYYSYYEMGNQDVLVLMLADSTVLYARPFSDSYIGKNLSSSSLFRDMLMKSDRGSGLWNAALDGKTRVFGFARSERYPLVVAAGFDTHSMLVQWMKSRLQDLALNLALLAAIVALGLFVLRQVRASLRYQLQLSQLRDELTLANQKLQSLALLDGLTGLANRRHFDAMLDLAIERAAGNGMPVSLILVDIDFFKRYNDTYGHPAGDECLRAVGYTLRRLPLRPDDIVARYGGEEFALILPDASAEEALGTAERAVRAVRELAISHAGSLLDQQRVTISAGAGTLLVSNEPQQAQHLIALADKALYNAKRQGRNQAARA